MTRNIDRIDGYDGYERATAPFNDRSGARDTESWREHAPEQSNLSVEDEQ